MILRAALLGALVATGAQASDAPPLPLPFAVGGPFELVDHTGAARTEVDPDGYSQMVFFGYANCNEICSAVLPLMADIADDVTAAGGKVRPVMITVDPERDTVENMGPALHYFHPDFVGLTGDEMALEAAYAAFQVEREFLFSDPEYGPVYSHGSFIYLLDGAGAPLTLIPPILDPIQAAEIVKKYVLSGAT